MANGCRGPPELAGDRQTFGFQWQARGAFRSNKAVLAQIERFRRSTRKAGKAAAEPQAK